jgi:hypothetical protein
MAPKNQPRQNKLQAWVRFGLRYLFDQDALDPINAPALAKELERLRANFINFANDPEGLEKTFNETVDELREAFVKANPRLRIRYASVISPPTEIKDTSH